MDKCTNCGANDFRVTEEFIHKAGFHDGKLEITGDSIENETSDRFWCVECGAEFSFEDERVDYDYL